MMSDQDNLQQPATKPDETPAMPAPRPDPELIGLIERDEDPEGKYVAR